MSYTILSASYANAEHTAAVAMTEEAATILISETDTPELWTKLHSMGLDVAAYEPPPPPPAQTYKADIWRRATDAEAETIETTLAQQPIRLRNLFRDAAYLDHSDPLFADLKSGFVQAFGQARADELLAPTE